MDQSWLTWNGLTTAVFGTGILSGLVAAGAREVIDAVKVSRRKKQEAHYLALHAAAALDAFAIEMAFLVSRIEGFYANNMPVGNVELPTISLRTLDCDWRLINVTLADELFSFENEVRGVQEKNDFTAIFEGHIEPQIAAMQAMGTQAATLASRIRKSSGLPSR